MRRCLEEFIVEGVPTTVPIHRAIFANPDFVAGNYSTAFIEESLKWEGSKGTTQKKTITLKRPGEAPAAQVKRAEIEEVITTEQSIE